MNSGIMSDERLERTKKLIGDDAIKRLRNANVAIFGIGGVGSYVCEAIARSGVGRITLIDGDVVDISNINRQLVALTSTIGKNKAEVMAERIRDINPDAEVKSIAGFYKPGACFDFSAYDYVVDAIDDVNAKVDIIKSCYNSNVKVISAMGTGNKLTCDKFKVTDLAKTHTDPLARVMRKRLREEGIENVKVVFSEEKPLQVEGVLGTMSYVPGAEGLIIASEVIRELAGLLHKIV